MQARIVSPSVLRSNSQKYRSYLDRLAPKIGVKKLDDWYNVQNKDLIRAGARGILARYGNSISNLLKAAYPEENWQFWRFQKVPVGYWKEQSNCRKCFDWLTVQLQLKQLDDWYNVKLEDISHHVNSGLLNQYGKSLCTALESVYPEHKWRKWKFHKVPNSCWNEPVNCREFLDWLAVQLHITKKEDWYSVKHSTLVDKGAASILNHFNDSLFQALSTAYPDFEPWQFWRFDVVPRGAWDNHDNVRAYMDWLQQQLGIKQLDQWDDIRTTTINQHGGRTLLDKYGGKASLLAAVYPEHKWKLHTDWNTMKAQHHLFTCVRYVQCSLWNLKQDFRKVLPSVDVFVNYRHPSMRYKDSGIKMEVVQHGCCY